MDLATVVQYTQVLGIGIAAISLVFTAWNSNRTRKADRTRFLLELRDRLTSLQDVHLALSPQGEWHGTNGCPASGGEWRRLEAYMGLLEHCERMLRDRLITWADFKAAYSYRVRNVTANPYIVQAKLIERGTSWSEFIDLTQRLGIDLVGTEDHPDDWPAKRLPAPSA